MNPDAELLHRYATSRSEEAFAAVVQRHIDLVYHAAVRRCGGDTHRAEDVTQQVFTAVAREAAALADHPLLAGWLYVATRNLAAKTMRAEKSRRLREETAHFMNEVQKPDSAAADWARLRPVLDDAIDELGEREREAVLLRYFENRPFAEIGASLKVTEDAARMRVDRALEKMHAALARRGVTSTTAALALALANHAGIAAPTGLAASVTGVAMAGATAGSGEVGAVAAAGLLHFMSTTKFLVSSAVVIAAAAIGVVTGQGRAARTARTEAMAVGGQQDELQAKLRTLEGALAAAEKRAAAADADIAQLLKAVQDVTNADQPPTDSGPRIAFVIDTSGSMRNPQKNMLWSGVFDTIAETLAARPDARWVQVSDADGAIMLQSPNGWRSAGAETLAEIGRVLKTWDRDTQSNPVPGVLSALRGLPASGDVGAKLDVVVIGDEFNAGDQAESVLRQLDKLNPADAAGKRRATISAVQLPTTIRFTGGSMANTGLKFQSLMTEAAQQHAGSYKLLSDGALH